MNAGKLRHQIDIEKKLTTRDAYGGEKVSFKRVISTRCSITYMNGKDGFTSDQFYGKNIIKLRLRYYPNISISDRIIYNDRIFDIIPPVKNINEKNRYLEIIAEEEIN